MELLSILNAVAVLALALIVGRQSRVIDEKTSYIAELEDENNYLNGLMHTPFDEMEFDEPSKPAKRSMTTKEAIEEAYRMHTNPGLTA